MTLRRERARQVGRYCVQLVSVELASARNEVVTTAGFDSTSQKYLMRTVKYVLG